MQQDFNIISTSGICGGVARINGTRIPVWILHRMRQFGLGIDEVLRSFPTLHAADVTDAWAYADQHPEEIQMQIEENEENCS